MGKGIDTEVKKSAVNYAAGEFASFGRGWLDVEKFRAAFRKSGPFEELYLLYSQKDTVERLRTQEACPDWSRAYYTATTAIDGADLSRRELRIARQMVGVIARAQRETGAKILTRYVGTDEEKVELLNDVYDLINAMAAAEFRAANGETK